MTHEQATISWRWDDMRQVGTDYADIGEVERYDRRMAEWRDVDSENASILAALSLPSGSSILEIGAGTGRFAIAAASAGHIVSAVDISPMMLRYIARRATLLGLSIDCVHAGFLEFPDAPDQYDAVVSCAAMHHLPDIWKTVAVERIAKVLKPGGQFILRDIFFDWEPGAHANCFNGFVDGFPETTQAPAARHIANEYSTHSWIMTGILERAGFSVLTIRAEDHSLKEFHCRK